MLSWLLLAPPVLAHEPGDRAIEFPDLPDRLTLACDLHMHTAFSDGHVWPTVRTWEAEKDGLDCIAVTEHLEYQPHADDIPHPDRNRSHAIAAEARSEDGDLIVINGSEITRDMPPGHCNAIFLDDANPLLTDKAKDAFAAAKRQGAFVFWNHPNWTRQRPSGLAELTRMHRQLIARGQLHGIEVVNSDTYSDSALAIALEHDLTILATSDIHGLIDWQHDVAGGGHRPVTLIFAAERTPEAIREALFAGRTVAWFDNTLIGRPEHVGALLDAILEPGAARYGTDDVLDVELTNDSDAELWLRNTSPWTLHDQPVAFALPPHATTTLHIETGKRLDRVAIGFEVLNAIVAPRTPASWTLTVSGITE